MKFQLSIIVIISLLFPIAAHSKQTSFATVEKASEMLFNAVDTNNADIVKQLFGTEYLHLLSFEDVDDNDRGYFIQAWKKSHKIITTDENLYYIEIGVNKWTFPIPLIKRNDTWIFDTATGAENILIRRIGRNELATIDTLNDYFDASSKGLFDSISSGVKNGYFYKKSNTTNDNIMLIAWPKEFGNSGVMTFILSKDGTLLQKNLSPDNQLDSLTAEKISLDSSWSIVRHP